MENNKNKAIRAHFANASMNSNNIPKSNPSLEFSLTWKDVDKELPKESGRYWCIVSEINELGLGHFQWNCSYNPNNISKWTDKGERLNVIWWTELAPLPFTVAGLTSKGI